jgi:hypothetical protein
MRTVHEKDNVSTSSSSALTAKLGQHSSTSGVSSSEVQSIAVAAPGTATGSLAVGRQVSPTAARFSSSSRDSVIVPHVDSAHVPSPSAAEATAMAAKNAPQAANQQQSTASGASRTNFSISSILGPPSADSHDKTTPEKRRHQSLTANGTTSTSGDSPSLATPADGLFRLDASLPLSSSVLSDNVDSDLRRSCAPLSSELSFGTAEEDETDKSLSLDGRQINNGSPRRSASHGLPSQLVADGGLSEAVRQLIERQLLAGKLAAAAVAAAAAAAAASGTAPGPGPVGDTSSPGAAGIWHPTTSTASWLHHQLPASILHRRLMADIASGQYSHALSLSLSLSLSYIYYSK